VDSPSASPPPSSPSALLAAQVWPYIATPVTRLQEFVGAERAIDALAAEIPEDAVVIAGGEGWHSAHTFNQIGGALALGRGRTVLPYRSPEATYAALHELLLGASGELPARSVFLLLNEATHVYRPRDDDGRPLAPCRRRSTIACRRRSSRARSASSSCSSTASPPSTGELPTRVTRADLRMALFEVQVDPSCRPDPHLGLRRRRRAAPPGLQRRPVPGPTTASASTPRPLVST
jgi:hypothetical protein